jgi:glycosyltransferase involved in cell wall biosynthesis
MSRGERVAIVMWSGVLGGAETFTAALARALRRDGIDASIIFVGDSEPLAGRLRADGTPFTSLGLPRGRAVLRHPRLLARALSAAGPEHALLVKTGFLAAAAKLGGYRGRVVAVNHGAAIHEPKAPRRVRAKRLADDLSGAWATDVEVAVSEAVLRSARRRPHGRRLELIYNAVDLAEFDPSPKPARSGMPVVGWAGRVITGKGLEDLIAAVARSPVQLRIAGEGPLLPDLKAYAEAEAVSDRVSFDGRVVQISSFWRNCDLGALPSNRLIESFGMSAVEAMASGLPVVAARVGAVPEVVRDGETGLLYEPGDVEALAHALTGYAADDDLRRAHGRAARRHCEERFDIHACAASYRRLLASEPGHAPVPAAVAAYEGRDD